MNALFVFPRLPVTYWGAQYTLRLIGSKPAVKRLLPIASDWLGKRDHPIPLHAEACVDPSQREPARFGLSRGLSR